ncbi:MAG TPA: peptidylprolyl isomerase [Acetobacteraceae bacterium]|nr:peptidylprolyl isomerase [Acetobacteraceae bacterium]
MPSPFGASARLLAAALLAAGFTSGAALAQTAPPQAAPSKTAPSQAAPAQATPAQPATAADPVVATVNGQPIHLSDLKEAAAGLPASAQSMPPDQLYPLLLTQLIDGKALVIEAQKDGLENNPSVQQQIQAAKDRVLESAVLHKAIGAAITEAALKARYEKDIAGKPGAEEVHARHILVPDEATAKKIIAQLDKGADFTALSKQYSKDPGSAQDGGDLGWFKQDEMVPAFSKAAFALKDGQITQTPVHTQFGWHVIQVLGHRKAPAPTFAQAEPELRQKIIKEGVQEAVAKARAQVKVVQYNLDGSTKRATDSAEPPPAKK